MSDSESRVLERPDPALPIVESVLVTLPREPKTPAPSPQPVAASQAESSSPPAPSSSAVEEEARQVWLQGPDASRKYRARHRRELFAIFIELRPGTLAAKRQATDDFLARVSVTERKALMRWLDTLIALTRSAEAD